MDSTRRRFVKTGFGTGAAFLGSGLLGRAVYASSNDRDLSSIEAFPRKYELKPLPFKPESLKGLSPKLITSHYENNYGGAVKNLMKVEAEIAKLPGDAPAFVMTGLKQNEHAFRNSMILHELYFENLGEGSKPKGQTAKMLSQAWGSQARFESEMKTAGAGVGGGTGWVILGWDLRTEQPILSCIGHNNQFAANSIPLLLMDVYEHAYAIDFGANLKGYIDAFFANINWDVIEKRLEKAEAISKLLKKA
jgi:superoxide dismutase, Fe-Mn family